MVTRNVIILVLLVTFQSAGTTYASFPRISFGLMKRQAGAETAMNVKHGQSATHDARGGASSPVKTMSASQMQTLKYVRH